MPSQKPVVLDGTRGPRADRIEDMRARSEAEPDPTHGITALPSKIDGTVYMSVFPSYCVQVTAPADQVDPITGRKTVGRPTKALFADGRYVNNAKDPKLRAFIDEVLQANSRFGKKGPGAGADFWLAETAIRVAQAAAKASAKETLRALAKDNPDELKRLISELQQGDDADVKMPAPPAAPGAGIAIDA